MTGAGQGPRLRSPAHGIHGGLGARFGPVGAWGGPASGRVVPMTSAVMAERLSTASKAWTRTS